MTLTLASASFLMDSTCRRTSAESCGTLAAALPASINSAESDWPTSSCSSREMARRSSSCAETRRAESSFNSCCVRDALLIALLELRFEAQRAADGEGGEQQTDAQRDRQHHDQAQAQGVEGRIEFGVAGGQLAGADLVDAVHQIERGVAPPDQFAGKIRRGARRVSLKYAVVDHEVQEFPIDLHFDSEGSEGSGLGRVERGGAIGQGPFGGLADGGPFFDLRMRDRWVGTRAGNRA